MSILIIQHADILFISCLFFKGIIVFGRFFCTYPLARPSPLLYLFLFLFYDWILDFIWWYFSNRCFSVILLLWPILLFLFLCLSLFLSFLLFIPFVQSISTFHVDEGAHIIHLLNIFPSNHLIELIESYIIALNNSDTVAFAGTNCNCSLITLFF